MDSASRPLSVKAVMTLLTASLFFSWQVYASASIVCTANTNSAISGTTSVVSLAETRHVTILLRLYLNHSISWCCWYFTAAACHASYGDHCPAATYRFFIPKPPLSAFLMFFPHYITAGFSSTHLTKIVNLFNSIVTVPGVLSSCQVPKDPI